MSGETEVVSPVVTEPVSNEVTAEATPAVSSEDFAALKAQIEKQTLLIDKLRDHEQSSLQREQEAVAKREGVEGEFDAFRTQVSEQLDDVLVGGALERELALAGARNVEVVMKLVNRQNIQVVNGKPDALAIRAAIDGLKDSDAYMFEDPLATPVVKPNATPVARAGEPENENIVNKELRAATSIEDLKAIIDKHNVRQ